MNLFDDVIKENFTRRKQEKEVDDDNKKGYIVLGDRGNTKDLLEELTKRMKGNKEFDKLKEQEKKSQNGKLSNEFFIVFLPKNMPFRRQIHLMRKPKKEIMKRRQKEKKIPKSVVDIILNNRNFSVLVNLLKRVNLVDTLRTSKSVTIFAPINKAFEGIDASKLSDEELRDILLYHVLAGAVDSSQLSKLDGKKVKTLSENNISISIKNNDVILNNNTKVIAIDLKSNNGVIHVINKVLLPPVDKKLDELDLTDLDDNVNGVLTQEDIEELIDINGNDEFFEDDDNDEFEGPIDDEGEDEDEGLSLTPEGSMEVSHFIKDDKMTTVHELTGAKIEDIKIKEYQPEGWENTFFLIEQ